MSAARDKLAEFMFIFTTLVLVMNCVFFSLGAPNIPWMVNIFNVIIWFDVHRKFISKLASYDDRKMFHNIYKPDINAYLFTYIIIN